MTFWTEDRIEWLRRNIHNGLSSGVTAYQIGCTRNAAIGKANRMGLHFKSKEGHKRKPMGGKRVRKKPIFIEQIYPYQEATVVPEPVYEPLHLSFGQLKDSPKISQCRFITCDGPTRYCGQPVIADSSWCKHCAKIVYHQRAA